MEHERGYTVPELLAGLALLAVLSWQAAGAAEAAMRRASLFAAASELRAVFEQVRMEAIGRDANLGIKFRNVRATWTWSVYEDADGDGVRNDDIRDGVDRELQRPRGLRHRPVVIGVAGLDVRDPFEPNALLSSRPAVRFDEPTLCAFSRQGDATNGSVVLTDGKRAAILRVDGASGRVDVYTWNGSRWRADE